MSDDLEYLRAENERLRERMVRIEADRDERWAQAEVVERKLAAALPALEWAQRQARKPFGVSMALDSFFADKSFLANLKGAE